MESIGWWWRSCVLGTSALMPPHWTVQNTIYYSLHGSLERIYIATQPACATRSSHVRVCVYCIYSTYWSTVVIG